MQRSNQISRGENYIHAMNTLDGMSNKVAFQEGKTIHVSLEFYQLFTRKKRRDLGDYPGDMSPNI